MKLKSMSDHSIFPKYAILNKLVESPIQSGSQESGLVQQERNKKLKRLFLIPKTILWEN